MDKKGETTKLFKIAVKINSPGSVKQLNTTAKAYNKGAHKEISNFVLCGVWMAK